MTGTLLDRDRTPLTASGPGAWLDGAPAVLALATDRPRPTALSHDTAHLQVELSAEALASLDVLAQRTGSDRHTVLLAAFRVLLMRTTDEQDVVLGCGSPTDPLDGSVLVVRAPVDPDASLASTVGQTAAALADSAARGRRTVPELVSDLGLEPGGGRHPVFQVGFTGTAGPLPATWPGSWSVPPDLVLSWWPEGERVLLGLQWAPELFDRQRVERLAGHLAELLRSGAEDDRRPVRLLDLLTAEELEELDTWNATTRPHDAATSLASRFLAQADRTPEAVAVEDGDQSVTYRGLHERATQVARVLRARGVDSDVTVAVCAQRSVDMVVAVLGTLLAGGAYVPVDPAYPAGRRDFMITDSGARVLLTQTSLAHVVPADCTAEVVLLDALPAVDAPAAGDAPLRGGSGHDLGYVIYTSGSTGQPKAVAMGQSALGNLVEWQLDRPQFVSGARTLQFSSLSFDVSFEEIFSTWASGGTLVLIDEATRRDPVRLLDHVREHRVERIFLPYVALRGLASAIASTGRRPDSLREVYTAGEQLQADAVLKAMFAGLPGSVLENQYGPSESHVVTAHTLGADPGAWPTLPPIGGPIANSQVHVVDSSLQRRPVGVPGELYLGGACLAQGYLGRPDLTDERFVPAPDWAGGQDRLYRTGDLARWLPSGDVEFLGRLDHQVKFRGYRIEPGEVGAVLSACPGVEQCVAVVRAAEAGPRLTAYLVPVTGQDLDLGAVHRYAKDHLPAYMVPSHYLVQQTLPLTSSGKIDTAALPDAPFDRGILDSPYQAPSTSVERQLTDIWSLLLGLPEVGVLDDFFELGGDSLLAAEMAQRVSEALGREMPLGALAQAPTIASLAALLATDDDSLYSSLVPLRPGEDGTTPLFVVHGGSGNVATFPRLARALPSEQPVYALQWDGFGGGRGQRTVARMAEHYLSEVERVQPTGPYLLAGQCIGGLVAHEMTRRLLQSGEDVRLLVMYDSPHLASDAYVPAPRPPLRQRLGSRKALASTAYGLAQTVYRRLPTRDPVRLGARVMRRAAWGHRPSPLPRPVPTHFVGSGESRGSAIALDGHWTDGAMGWGSSASPSFSVHRLQGDHNGVLYEPAAVELLRAALRRAHQEIAAQAAS